MNCQDALNLLYEIIDKEASEIDAAQVREHLGNCRHCFEVYRIETAVNDLLTERVKASSSPKSLDCVESLRGKLLAQLDQIDADTHKERIPSARKPFGNVAVTLAVAASLVVIAGAAFVGRGLYHHHQVFTPLEKAHWRTAGNTETPPDHSAPIDRVMALADSIHAPLGEKVGQFSLINGHIEDLSGVQMGHFVYENGQKFVSVFAAPAVQFKIPDDLRDNTFAFEGRQYFYHNCRGCRLLYVQNGDMVLVGATTDKNLDLTGFLKDRRTA